MLIRHGKKECYALKELYCKNGECNFYNPNLNIPEIETAIDVYYKKRMAENKNIRKKLKIVLDTLMDIDLTDIKHRLKSQQKINKVYKVIDSLDAHFERKIICDEQERSTNEQRGVE